MSLSDLADKPSPKGALAVEIHMPAMDPIAAMKRFISAVHAREPEQAYDAFCMLKNAHEESQEKAPDSSPDTGYEDEG